MRTTSSTAARKAIDSGPGGGDPAVREAVETIETVALGLSLFAPCTAEDMRARLGYEPSIANYGRRGADASLVTVVARAPRLVNFVTKPAS